MASLCLKISLYLYRLPSLRTQFFCTEFIGKLYLATKYTLIKLYFQWLVKFTVFHTSKRKMYKRFSWRLVFRKNILPSRKKPNQIYGKKITWWLYHEVHFCTSATLRLSAFALKFSKQFGNFSSGLARIRTVFDYFFHLLRWFVVLHLCSGCHVLLTAKLNFNMSRTV